MIETDLFQNLIIGAALVAALYLALAIGDHIHAQRREKRRREWAERNWRR